MIQMLVGLKVQPLLFTIDFASLSDVEIVDEIRNSVRTEHGGRSARRITLMSPELVALPPSNS